MDWWSEDVFGNECWSTRLQSFRQEPCKITFPKINQESNDLTRVGYNHKDDSDSDRSVIILDSNSSTDSYDEAFPKIKTKILECKYEANETRSKVIAKSDLIGEPCAITFPQLKQEVKVEVKWDDTFHKMVAKSSDCASNMDGYIHNVVRKMAEKSSEVEESDVLITDEPLVSDTSKENNAPSSSSKPLGNSSESCALLNSDFSSHTVYPGSAATRSHLAPNILNQTSNYFSCPICQVCFPDKKTMNIHSRSHANKSNYSHLTNSDMFGGCGQASVKPLSYSVCKAKFSRRCTSKQHSITQSPKTLSVNSVRTAKHLKKSSLKKCKCNFRTSKKLHTCPLCGTNLSFKSELIRHMRTHASEKQYSCSQCNAKFSKKGHLNVHMLTHAGKKPFSCSMCSEIFSQKSHLSYHIRTRRGEKPFSCSICAAQFCHKMGLTRHAYTHTGEKPFPCIVCGAEFSNNSHLKEHVWTHTGEKPFSCSVCAVKFSRLSFLNDHFVKYRHKNL